MPNSYVMSYRFVPFVVGLMKPSAHRIVEGDVEEEKKRNRSTSARTCTSVVRAHRGADIRMDPKEHRRGNSNDLEYPTFIFCHF